MLQESSAGVDIEISDDEEYHDTFPCEEDLFEHEDESHIKSRKLTPLSKDIFILVYFCIIIKLLPLSQ